MSRTPARFTQADLNRAVKVAAAQGMRVRVTRTGDIILEPVAGIDQPERSSLDTSREIHM